MVACAVCGLGRVRSALGWGAVVCPGGYRADRPRWPMGTWVPEAAGERWTPPDSNALEIGETGFEPATARPPAGCATRLRHSPWCYVPERATGIEPALEAWKASVQPQHFARRLSGDDTRARAARR